MHCKKAVSGVVTRLDLAIIRRNQLAVFFTPFIFHGSFLSRVIHIMAVLSRAVLGLVAPSRGITTPFKHRHH
jgi:hypothetical protein